jgi:hypothetical protein
LKVGFPSTLVDVEYQARFPWSGGRHPWLDAIALTATHLIGIESKRFEPFRDTKKISLSTAYDRQVWGDAMEPYERLRDRLRSGDARFVYLDAVQLLKHAFGLITDARRKSKIPTLVYLFAEPFRLDNCPIPIDEVALEHHRAEISTFADAVRGAQVGFYAISYREWIASWTHLDPSVTRHGEALLNEFQP